MDTKERLNRILARHTHQSMERVKADSDRDNFMNAEAAVAYGMIDKVLEKRVDAVPTPSPDRPA